MLFLRLVSFFVLFFTLMVSSFAIAQAKPVKNELEQLQRELESVKQKLTVLEAKQNSPRTLRNFHVVAFFNFDKKTAEKLLGEKPIAVSFGLPTIKYDWICPTPNCEGATIGSNIFWKNPKNIIPTSPPVTSWTHVAVRTFSTSAEADSWLTDTKEGKFVSKHAEILFSTTTTAYAD
jgi:hypothetical protein